MRSTNSKFTLDLADGWKDCTVHYFMGPEDGGLEHALTLVVDPEPSSNDLQEYAHERVDQAIESLKSTVVEIDDDVAALVKDLEESIREADSFIASMEE